LRFNRETKDEIQLSVFVKGVKEYYESRSKIKINIEINNDFSIRANSGKLTQIIDNIILNSEFWLNDITKTNTEFQPQLNIIVDSPFLKIFDNGYGIIPALENNLFQPFVTTKPQGRGLGLFIVQQLLDTLSGNIVLLNKRNVHNRRYIFQITFNLK
jgi:nitrogen fixation/metabolism regulation signal transduction histidine kinase